MSTLTFFLAAAVPLALAVVVVAVAIVAIRESRARHARTQGRSSRACRCGRGSSRRLGGCGAPCATPPCERANPAPPDDVDERRERHEAAQRRGKDHFRAERERVAYLSGASRRENDPERERLLHDAAIRQYAADLPNHRHKDRYTRKFFPTDAGC